MPDMIEYASFGFAVLVWWTWPLLWIVVVSAVYVSYRLSARRERRLEQARGLDVRPCRVHMGTDPAGGEPGDWVRVSNKDGDQMLVEADDPEGVAIAMDTLKGE